MAKRIQIEKGSGNVLADIGLPNPEEALAKAEIARQVNRILVARKLSQAEAGVILGIAQPRVSDLFRGRLGRFSLDRSEEHTSELQSLRHLVCRLLLEKKKINYKYMSCTVSVFSRYHVSLLSLVS